MEELNINYEPIAEKLTELIKQKIEEEGHVKTGNLLDSIETTTDGEGFYMEAEDYYQYVDEKSSMSEDVCDSDELISFFEIEFAEQAEEDLAKQLQEILDNK